MSSTLFDAVVGSLQISQVRNQGFNAGNNITALTPSGGIDPMAFYLQDGQPRGNWTTTDLSTVLGAGGISPVAGLWVPSGTIKLPWRKRAVGSTYAGSTSHEVVTATRGLIVPTKFEAPEKGACTCDFGFAALSSDGMTSPVTIATAQTLPAQGIIDVFRLAPAFITAGSRTKLGGCVGITVDPGIQVLNEDFDGAVWPINSYIQKRNPSIEFKFLDQSQLATFGPLVKAATACEVFFRKMLPGGTVYDDAEEEHLGFSFADCIVDVQDISASENNSANPSIKVWGEALSWAVDTAIA